MTEIKYKNGFPQIGSLLYESMGQSDHQTDPNSFAPSYLTACERQIYYKKRLEKPSDIISKPALFKMEMGTEIHKYIQDILKKQGVYKEGEELKEAKFQGLKWKYATDGILEIGNKKYIIEIKTVYGAGFRFVETEPKEDHLMQLMFYMKVENIDNGILIYVGRDNGRILQHDFCFYGGTHLLNGISTGVDFATKFSSYISKMQILRIKINKGEMPDRPYKLYMKRYGDKVSQSFVRDRQKYKTDWHCTYCQYFTKCHKYALDKFEEGKYNFLIDNKLIKSDFGQDEVLDLNKE